MRTLQFLLLLTRTNLRASLELRAAFLLQAGFMAANNLIYLGVWWVFFHRFHDLRGFGMQDMALTYGVVAGGFGLSVALAGGLRDLARRIVEGDLDTYLTQPKPVLLQALCSRTAASGWGDLLSGVLMIAGSGRVPLAHAPYAALAMLLSACVFVSAGVAFSSAAFWLGPVDSLARSLWEFMITFSVYPEPLFGGSMRLVLYTVLPAAFSGFLPSRFAHEPTLVSGATAIGGALLTLGCALFVFDRGLRRYESGNLVGAH